MKNLCNKYINLHTILLPIFFVLHSWNNFYYLIAIQDTLWILFMLLISCLLLNIIIVALLRNKHKAGVLTFYIASFIFFYGYIYDQLQHIAKDLSRHSILLCLSFASFVIIFSLLRKQSPLKFVKLNKYLNLLFILLLLYEGVIAGSILLRNFKKEDFTTKVNKSQNLKFPNIYILVFDEYASTKSLSRDFGYNNSNIDSFLLKKNFFLMQDSKSNYLRTNLSIASLLNFDYTSGLETREGMNSNDLLRSHKQIKYNALFSLARNYGYEIFNYSIFDMELSPSKVKNEYLFNNERIIISNTMISRLINDLGPSLNIKLLKKILGTNITAETYRRYNQKAVNVFLSDLKKEKHQAPKLAYAHFLMPHPPFLYDSSSNPIYFDDQKMENYYDKKFIPNYINYLPYTNSHLKSVINAILLQNNSNCIVFVLGDHGYKIMNDSNLSNDHFFNNLQALYLPSGKYQPLKVSSTPINVMRHIINTTFNEKLPYLVDSAVLQGNKW
ncbi:sulfatase-like protein [Lacibacter cauensis]|uniref:Sulfatase-like protein n=1 Tax=Lacibacter cauensis TaxID=510947 RepID=A0A562SCN4_9BACT|nr:sulfatase-like hydrolase/transferase [Lacibacter cauensis]TWI79089.1 sulfatase-like protein [Lacibacter cauensis]